MDRPEPGLIKWSPNPSYDNFLHVNLQHRVVQIYEATGQARRGRFDFAKLSKHDDFPPLTTYDWAPSTPGLMAVGTSSGVVNLLRVDDSSNAYLELNLRVSRVCHAVSFNTGNLLAVGLERVRNDQCLHIWDVNRQAALSQDITGFSPDNSTIAEPVQRLEPSVAVSSVKFFEDSPNTMAVGIKNSGIHIYDLRDSHGPVINFQTRCCNNLTIDYADQNYFASSTLDQPAVMIWDRRARSRPTASPFYLEAVENDDLPWGAALRIDKAINIQEESSAEKHSLIRSLRFCRGQRGLLAALSRSGQLKIIDTQKERATQDVGYDTSPELLQVRRSDDLDLKYIDYEKRHDRIVSFDWVTMPSPVLNQRIVVLRANGAFEIIEKPSHVSEHVYKMVPWRSPFRGLEENSNYHSLMKFEPSQHPQMMGPLLLEQVLLDAPLFGEEPIDVGSVVQEVLESRPTDEDTTEEVLVTDHYFPESFSWGATASEKMLALRTFSKEILNASGFRLSRDPRQLSLGEFTQSIGNMSLNREGPPSSRELHEILLNLNTQVRGFPKEAQVILDHVALFRANDKYLFDFGINRDIVSDDPWLRNLWDWIAGAEKDASDGGMMAQGLDLSFMGAQTIWANDLGRQSFTRLSEGPSIPDRNAWERCLQIINQRRREAQYEGAKTEWPAHRQACIRVCGLGRSIQADFVDYAKTPLSERNSSWYTMTAARAMFTGDNKQAVQTLKRASTDYPELLFVSLALQLLGEDFSTAKEKLDFDEAVASKTDPYLRAISSLIATNDWETIANQESLPLRERTYVAFRYFDDKHLTKWLNQQVTTTINTADLEGVLLIGITDKLADVFGNYVGRFYDIQTAALVMSICAPRYIDDYRCLAWRNAYRAYLQRHKAFYQRTKFEVESTKRSKRNGVPTVKPPSRQIALRCVYCDAEYELSKSAGPGPPPPPTPNPGGGGAASSLGAGILQRNPLMARGINAGVCCPNCGRHLPRCVVCLEVVGIPRSSNSGNGPSGAGVTSNNNSSSNVAMMGMGIGGDRSEAAAASALERRSAARFPTFCLKCEHVLHLDHARQWFRRHIECPVPECRCKCNFRANPELNYR